MGVPGISGDGIPLWVSGICDMHTKSMHRGIFRGRLVFGVQETCRMLFVGVKVARWYDIVDVNSGGDCVRSWR